MQPTLARRSGDDCCPNATDARARDPKPSAPCAIANPQPKTLFVSLACHRSTFLKSWSLRQTRGSSDDASDLDQARANCQPGEADTVLGKGFLRLAGVILVELSPDAWQSIGQWVGPEPMRAQRSDRSNWNDHHGNGRAQGDQGEGRRRRLGFRDNSSCLARLGMLANQSPPASQRAARKAP